MYQLNNPGDVTEKNALDRHTALMKILDAAIERGREERNRVQAAKANQSYLNQMMGTEKQKSAPAPTTPAAPGKGKDKGGKGKGKDKSRRKPSVPKAPNPGGPGKGKGGKPSGKPSLLTKNYCFHHVFDRCNNPNCQYVHEMPKTEEERAELRKKDGVRTVAIPFARSEETEGERRKG